MNEEVPSLEEIMAAWERKCPGLNCKECSLEDSNSRYSCRDRYVHAVITGKMKLTDSFKKEEPKPEFPAWFKPGAWVMSREGYPLSKKPMMIEDIQPDGKATLGCNGWSVWRAPEEVDPIKFRPYTFEEAKGLLGKVMEYKSGPDTYATIVYKVSNNSGRVRINDWSQEFLFHEYEATIDGIPLGVPEADEEALKGGQE